MTASANPIEDLAGAIQTLPNEIRWLHAIPNVIQSRACGTPLLIGPKTRSVARLLAAASLVGLARITAVIGSFVLLLDAYRRQKRVEPRPDSLATLFVGVGALREAALVQKLEQDSGKRVSTINENSIEAFSSEFPVKFVELVKEWLAVLRVSWGQLGGKQLPIGLPPENLCVEFLTQAHRYSFLRTWFRSLRHRRKIEEPIVFSAASAVAYAAVSAGWKTAYHLHGFQRQSLVYPDFDEVLCFSAVEAAHMARRLPNARICVREEPGEQVATEYVVAIAGAYGQTEGFDDCADFIEWAGRQRIPVIVRVHPLDSSGFFSRWRSDPNVCFADVASSFDTFLERCRPRLLLSWYSTALFDALRRGVVPVTVRTEPWRPLDTVFPFQEISLRWPQDREQVQRIMTDHAERAALLEHKRAVSALGAQC